MKKQTGFTFRNYVISSVNPSISRPVFEMQIKEEYLDNGWEVMGSGVTKVDANELYVWVSFSKYEDVPEVDVKKRANS